MVGVLRAQPAVDVTFRFIPAFGSEFVRVFVPGEFNGWGPNNQGQIAANAPSLMTFNDSLEQWLYSIPLITGRTYEYKVHLHLNQSGSQSSWISDPLNPLTNPANNNNSVLTITDPMIFQPAQELNATGQVQAVSASILGSRTITDVRFEINGVEREGLDYFDTETGVFRFELAQPIADGSQFKLTATDQAGQTITTEIGEILNPVKLITQSYSTVEAQAEIKARVVGTDGTIDPNLTAASLFVNDVEQVISVDQGVIAISVDLELGPNRIQLMAEVEGQSYTTDEIVVTRTLHPLDYTLTTVEVTGEGLDFNINVKPTEHVTGTLTLVWAYDSLSGTTDVEQWSASDQSLQGRARGSGELYYRLIATTDDGQTERRRIAVLIEEDGTARAMRYEENAAWIKSAVVYEIFPLSFGPEAGGTPSNPGRRLREITNELDYIAGMGFNAIWFMPVFHNQVMSQQSAGYNIIDFYSVDPKLGTNEDFKALVNRAHELGIRIVLDMTPNHVSSIHAWVEDLRNEGPLADYIQTTPSAHDRGLDNRGPNLAEIWQVEGGGNLYRKYDGFGDLANLNWDNDDLQASILDILQYWVEVFDIDGWRFDVYWGPWRRYGPERFGKPIRELMKRIKPDIWLLGEIAGTGNSTEVYYADADNGQAVVGGLDAGYDWKFYFDGIRGTYNALRSYDALAHNGDFYPGPNARYFRFLENHDEERIAKRFSSNPNQILPLTGFLLTTTGIPMIYQGQEVNFGDVSGDDRRVSVTWETERNGMFASYHQNLIQTRRQFPAFWTQDLATLNTNNSVYVYVRPYLDENAIVLINFAGDVRTIQVNPTPEVELTTDGPISYTHLFADSTFVDQELDGFEITLRPYETIVLIGNGGGEVAFEPPVLPSLPFGGVYVSSETEVNSAAFDMDANYPNPFTSTTTIRYTVPSAAQVRVEVFDVLGRRLATLVNSFHRAGTFSTTWDATNWPDGIYLYQVQVGEQAETRKMVLIR